MRRSWRTAYSSAVTTSLLAPPEEKVRSPQFNSTIGPTLYCLDSTVLIHVISKLNRERDYGLNLTLLSIDEGIRGYRDDSLATVQRNREEYGLPLKVSPHNILFMRVDDIRTHRCFRTRTCMDGQWTRLLPRLA